VMALWSHGWCLDVGMYHKLDIVAAFVLWLWRHTTGLPGYARILILFFSFNPLFYIFRLLFGFWLIHRNLMLLFHLVLLPSLQHANA
jgi:hypothetical protein